MATVERSHFNALDSLLNDERHLEWINHDISFDIADVVSAPVAAAGKVRDLPSSQGKPEERLRPIIGNSKSKNLQDSQPEEIDFLSLKSCDQSACSASSCNTPVHMLSSTGVGEPTLEATMSLDAASSIAASDLDETGDEQDDDGNAWFGCVCGVVHRGLAVFWIQCDSCDSWYNVCGNCVGFSESEAQALPNWVCNGCQDSTNNEQCDTFGDPGCLRSPIAPRQSQVCKRASPISRSSQACKRKSSVAPKGEHCNSQLKPGKSPSTEVAQDITEDAEINATIAPERKHRFKAGDHVFVSEHGWIGVNNPEGVAIVLEAYKDEDDDFVYDIKYVVGYKKKAVLEEYLSCYSPFE